MPKHLPRKIVSNSAYATVTKQLVTYTSVVTIKPTCTTDGIQTFTCSECGDSYTEAIPKLDCTPAETGKENEASATCAEAGAYDEVV